MNFQEFLFFFKNYEKDNQVVRYLILHMFIKNYIKKYTDS